MLGKAEQLPNVICSSKRVSTSREGLPSFLQSKRQCLLPRGVGEPADGRRQERIAGETGDNWVYQSFGGVSQPASRVQRPKAISAYTTLVD